MRRIAFVLLFGLATVLSGILAAETCAEELLILHEPGFAQKVVSENMTPELNTFVYAQSPTSVDAKGNFYFIFSAANRQKIIKRVTPGGVLSDFAEINELPDHNDNLSHLERGPKGSLYVAISSFNTVTFESFYTLIRISKF